MSYERDYSQAMARIIDVTKRTLVQNGLNETIATELAVEVCDGITEEFVGQLFYVPVQFRAKLAARNRDIYHQHCAGSSMNDLCASFKLSHPRIFEILRKEEALVMAEKQLDLFG